VRKNLELRRERRRFDFGSGERTFLTLKIVEILLEKRLTLIQEIGDQLTPMGE